MVRGKCKMNVKYIVVPEMKEVKQKSSYQRTIQTNNN